VREVEGSGGRECEYVSWETFYGLQAQGMRVVLSGRVQRMFEAQGEDLKAWVEGGMGKTEL